MSDIAEGSTAVRQLQQNVAAAPYIQDLTQAASERKIQEDRLAKQYAPEMMAAKAEEEQMRLQTARLQKLATDNQYKADTESTAKLQQWLQTDDGKKASDLDITKKSASLKMQAGLTEQGSKLYERAEKIEATELANQTKQLAQDNETIAKAAVVLDAVPSEKVDEFFGRLPEEQKKLILKQVGEDNWTKATGEEKKKIVDRLFLNAKGQLTEQLKAVELEKTKLITKNRLDIENNKEAAAENLKNMTTASAEKIAAEKIAGAIKLEEQKSADKIKEQEAKHKEKLEELSKKHTDEMDKLKQQTVDKKELENLKSQHQKELENVKGGFKKQIESMKESASKTKSDKKDSVKDAAFYIKEHDKIVKAGQKEEDDLKAQVATAEKLMTESKTASWYEPKAYKEDKRTKAYTAAVNKLNDFRKRQTQREIETFENAPDFPKKEEILRKLKQTLAAVDTPPMDKEPPSAKAEAAPAPAKDVPSGAKTHDGYPARQNSDGSYSTEVSITVTNPKLNSGKPTNIPSLWKGKEVDEDTAVKNALDSGNKYPSFSTIPEAVKAAKERSKAGGAGATSNKLLSESEFNKQWPTLKKGQSLIGPDGKTYTKGG